MKNPKLEAAQRRLFNGRTVLPNKPFEGIKINDLPEWFPKEPEDAPKYMGCTFHNERCDGVTLVSSGCPELIFEFDSASQPPFVRLKAEVDALQKLLNEKDEQIDRLQRPMVVRLDWWAVGLVVLVVGAQYLGYL